MRQINVSPVKPIFMQKFFTPRKGLEKELSRCSAVASQLATFALDLEEGSRGRILGRNPE
jgi:hypothetical protein